MDLCSDLPFDLIYSFYLNSDESNGKVLCSLSFFFFFLVDSSFAVQEIHADHETLMKISAAGESGYSVSIITEI